MKQSLKLTLVCVAALTVTASPLTAIVPAGSPAELSAADKAPETSSIALTVTGMT